jgi:hypothetical protein
MINDFDAVEMVRGIRDRLYNQIKDMPREEQKRFIRERTERAMNNFNNWKDNYDSEKVGPASDG